MVEKKAAYVAAGIPAYLIVFLTAAGDGIEQIEEYRLSEGRYHPGYLHTRRLTLDVPVPIDIAFGELTTGQEPPPRRINEGSDFRWCTAPAAPTSIR